MLCTEFVGALLGGLWLMGIAALNAILRAGCKALVRVQAGLREHAAASYPRHPVAVARGRG